MLRAVFTVGHSTHPLPEFIALLHAWGVAAVIDVRALPGSRRQPQFNRDRLPPALAAAGIAYAHAPALGGRRRGGRDSVNRAWRNASFRAYADYMQTAEFSDALADLLCRAETIPLAIM